MLRSLPLALFLFALTVFAAYIIGSGVVEFGEVNYWQRHGFLLLIGLTLFPRLTLIFSSIPFGGLWWWLGLIFMPRYLVAILATLTYGLVNPFLVFMAWMVAIGGESSEKYVIKRRVYYYRSPVHQSRDRVIDTDSRPID